MHAWSSPRRITKRSTRTRIPGVRFAASFQRNWGLEKAKEVVQRTKRRPGSGSTFEFESRWLSASTLHEKLWAVNGKKPVSSACAG